MTGVQFRNVDVGRDEPVESWPFEAVLTALERGTLPDWRKLARAIAAAPWGSIARQVEEAISLASPYGTGPLFGTVIEQARTRACADERESVAQEIGDLLDSSGLTREEFARSIGTSPSRLSTYLTGKVTPSAALLVRMRRLAATSPASSAGASR